MYITCNFQGSVHQAMEYVSGLKCCSHLFQVVYLRPDCILIFKVPAREDRAAVRAELGLSNPEFNSGDLMAAMLRDRAGS